MGRFSKRTIEEREWLDGDGQSIDKLKKVLSDLKRINSYFGLIRDLRFAINSIKERVSEKIKVVDVGCGLGSNLFYVKTMLSQMGPNVSAIGLDKNPQILDFATKLYDRDIDFKKWEWGIDEIPEGDIMIITHFLYHLDEHQIEIFLDKAYEKGYGVIVISELLPSKTFEFIFPLVSRLLGFQRETISDGMMALRNSISAHELQLVFQRSKFDFEHYIRRFNRQLVISTRQE